jgi:hypothetical protein
MNEFGNCKNSVGLKPYWVILLKGIKILLISLNNKKNTLNCYQMIIEAALKLSSVAKEAVEFLKQKKVAAKTLEPNFCHAKIISFQSCKR